MKKIGKLVRDNIPKLIEQEGDSAIARILGTEEYVREMEAKLKEEVEEFLEEHDVNELADILEVIHAYCDHLGLDFDELEEARVEKKREKGGLEKRVYLVGINRKN